MKMLEMGAKASNQTIDEFIKSGKASEAMTVSGEFRNEKIEGDTAIVSVGCRRELIAAIRGARVIKRKFNFCSRKNREQKRETNAIFAELS